MIKLLCKFVCKLSIFLQRLGASQPGVQFLHRVCYKQVSSDDRRGVNIPTAAIPTGSSDMESGSDTS
jgi:hypothetical protein